MEILLMAIGLIVIILMSVSTIAYMYVVYQLLHDIKDDTKRSDMYKDPLNNTFVVPRQGTLTQFDADSYVPDNSDQTVPIEDFIPNPKQPIKVKYTDDEDQITPLEDKQDGKEAR